MLVSAIQTLFVLTLALALMRALTMTLLRRDPENPLAKALAFVYA